MANNELSYHYRHRSPTPKENILYDTLRPVNPLFEPNIYSLTTTNTNTRPIIDRYSYASSQHDNNDSLITKLSNITSKPSETTISCFMLSRPIEKIS